MRETTSSVTGTPWDGAFSGESKKKKNWKRALQGLALAVGFCALPFLVHFALQALFDLAKRVF